MKISPTAIKLAVKTACKFAKKYRFVGYVIGGVGLMGAAAYDAAKQSPKAKEAIEKAEEAKGEELTLTEKIKVGGRYFIRPAALGISGAALIFGGEYAIVKRAVGFESAYLLLRDENLKLKSLVDGMYVPDTDINGDDIKAIKQFSKKSISEMTKDDWEEVDKAKKKAYKTDFEEDASVTVYDTFTERTYTNCSLNQLRYAASEVRKRVESDNRPKKISVNTFYNIAGLKTTGGLGDLLFFDAYNPCYVDLGYGADKNGPIRSGGVHDSCYTMDFRYWPVSE